MSALHLALWFCGAVLMAAGTYLILGRALTTMLSELLPERVAAAFNQIVLVGIVVIAILAGVGFLPRGYYGYPKEPEGVSEWFATFYNAMASSGCAIFSFLGVICFACLVLHVGVVRAKIAAERK